MHPATFEKRSVGSPKRLGTGLCCIALALVLASSTSARAQASSDVVSDSPPQSVPPAAKSVDDADAPMPTRLVWEYALLGTAIAGIATGVTLVTVNHARVNDYNLGVRAYDQGIDVNAGTLAQLQSLRDSINTGERYGYIVGGVGLAAALGAAYLYLTDDELPSDKGGVALGPGSFTIYGYF